MKLTSDSPSGRRPRRRFTADQIRSYVDALDRSGKSVAAFAREHDLVYSVLSRWVQRRSQGARRRGRPPKLREVSLGALLGAGRWAAEIVRPDGLTVRVAHDAPVTWLNGLLARGTC
jgi:transposase-like protein